MTNMYLQKQPVKRATTKSWVTNYILLRGSYVNENIYAFSRQTTHIYIYNMKIMGDYIFIFILVLKAL